MFKNQIKHKPNSTCVFNCKKQTFINLTNDHKIQQNQN